MSEIGRAAIDALGDPGGAKLGEQGALSIPLLDESSRVLVVAAGQELLAKELELVDDRRLVGLDRLAHHLELG